jgi:transketolase
MRSLPTLDLEDLAARANRIRREVVEIACANGAGHIAPSLSCIDILAVLYYRCLHFNNDPSWPERDRLVFSKGHGAYGLYAILADLGWIPREDWTSFYRGSPLSGCIERDVTRGIEAGTGSLGHGLPIAAGMAFGARIAGYDWRTVCILGDGEMQEGSCWEAIQFAVKHRLGNLLTIVDANRLQAMDFLDRVLTPADRDDDLRRKLEGFGMEVADIDGHDQAALARVIGDWRDNPPPPDRPIALIAHTIKGYGVKAMENVPHFHFRLPTAADLAQGVRYE